MSSTPTSETVPASLDAASTAARLSRLPARGMALRVMVATAAAYFFDLYDQSAFGIVAPAMRVSEGFSLNNIATLVSVTFTGMLIGALIGGRIADRHGRLPILRVGLVLASLGSLGHVFASGLITFGAFRLVTAIGMGIIFVVAMTYLAEVSPVHRRGSRIALTAFFGGIGGATVAVLGRTIIPLDPDAWRWLFAIGGLGLLALGLLVRLPESPLWLLSRGRADEAEQELQRLERGVERAVGTLPPVVIENIVHEVAADEESVEGSGWRGAFRGKMLRPTILLMAIWIVYSTVTQVFSVWLATILQMRGFDSETLLTITMVAIVGAPVGMLLATAFADRLPRKVQFFGVAVIAGIVGLLFGIVPAAGVIGALAFAHFMLIAWFSPVLNAAMMDEYPSALRSTGAGVAYSSGRLWSIIFPFTVAAALSAYGAGIIGWVLLTAWMLVAILGLGLRGSVTSRSTEPAS
ncbi:MFS transporter [Rhodococcus sp. DMU1]|uniref:MFS transporter n=1 Tax=Rhodococcus sp. DMU1 TaxID=2722825 RepID=UPI00143E12B7|nr:MFS transporter [Rhodococcus sp. DMU1]QIX53738.1 MFS transporter [Rhodococcus sp. DMU1]